MSNTIHDLPYRFVAPSIRHEDDRRKAKARVHVQGYNKADGSPIRFKSLKRADNHIRNMQRLP